MFVAFSISMNAQNIIDRQTIKDNPNNLTEFVNQDIAILRNNFPEFNKTDTKVLSKIFYFKYKSLTADLSNEELIELTDTLKEQLKTTLGDQLYSKIAENKDIFNRVTGTTYLTK